MFNPYICAVKGFSYNLLFIQKAFSFTRIYSVFCQNFLDNFLMICSYLCIPFTYKGFTTENTNSFSFNPSNRPIKKFVINISSILLPMVSHCCNKLNILKIHFNIESFSINRKLEYIYNTRYHYYDFIQPTHIACNFYSISYYAMYFMCLYSLQYQNVKVKFVNSLESTLIIERFWWGLSKKCFSFCLIFWLQKLTLVNIFFIRTRKIRVAYYKKTTCLNSLTKRLL